MKKLSRHFLNFCFIFASLIPLPVHAYAGPGVAIGAVIVFLTVIFAFIASSFITIYEYSKKIIGKFRKLIVGKRNIRSKNKDFHRNK